MLQKAVEIGKSTHVVPLDKFFFGGTVTFLHYSMVVSPPQEMHPF